MTRSRLDHRSHLAPRCGPERLFEGEQLLLWMVRQWVIARVTCESPRARLAAVADRYGAPGSATCVAMLMMAIEEHVKRPLCILHPDCPGYARDEQHIITACGVSPAEPDLAARLLEGLVIAPDVVAVMARVVNASLAREGFILPVRLDDTPRPPTPPNLCAHPTLH